MWLFPFFDPALSIDCMLSAVASALLVLVELYNPDVLLYADLSSVKHVEAQAVAL